MLQFDALPAKDKISYRRAQLADFKGIVSLIDNEFTKEGFGFVNRAQISTEISKHRVLVAILDGSIVGIRIGIDTCWNLVVSKKVRGKGIGKGLINLIRPRTIRVKSDPIGHLSNQQKKDFVDPTVFYEKLGFTYWGNSYPKNFWQRGADHKGQFHIKGTKAHIKIYKEPNAVMQLEIPKEEVKQGSF